VLAVSLKSSIFGEGVTCVQEKGMPIPPGKEEWPYIKVLKKFFVRIDMLKAIGHLPCKVYDM